MPRTASTGEHAGQDPHLLILLCAFLRSEKSQRLFTCVLFFVIVLAANYTHAIPPNTPITNTATADFAVGGVNFSVSGSETVITDANSGNSPPYGVQVVPASVPENASGATVGTFVITDLDPTDTHSVSVSDPRFSVVAGSLQLGAANSLDFETEPSVSLTVTVTDNAGAQFIGIVVVTVTDVNEAPVDVMLDSLTVTAAQAGALVGMLAVVDPDTADSHSYVVDDTRFEVVAGQLKLLDTETLILAEVVTLLVTATDSGGLTYAESFTVTAVPPAGGAGNNSNIAVYQYAPGAAGAQTFDVGASQCDAGSGLVNLPPPNTAYGGVITAPGTNELLATNMVKSGDALFIQVIDPDANLDATVYERLLVTITTDSLDTETLSMLETGPDSGVFVGYMQTILATMSANNCSVEVDGPQNLTVSYNNVNNVLVSAVLNVLVDPFGLVFDSASGTPINGSQITIVDAVSNLPAQVFADDGLSAFPATIVSGDPSLSFAAGTYRFPFVASGDYLFQITPPNRFAFPSAALDADLQSLPGAPYALGPGSRGQTFNVPVGPAVRVDIPLDLLPIVPTSSQLELFAIQSGSINPSTEYLQQAQCFNGASYITPAAPVSLAQGVVSVPGSVDLTTTDRFARGDVILLKLVDPDQDLDPFAADVVDLDVSVPGQLDAERIRLVETNDSTGIFTGYLQTALATTVVANNCLLEANPSSAFEVRYSDPVDAGDTSIESALFDPGFTTFSSADGTLVQGATVTLLDAATSLEATAAVFSADGVTPFPATVVVGSPVTDSAGQILVFAPGTFTFPVITPGDYRLQVTAPASYEFPSQVDDATLTALSAGPFVLNQGSRGGDFTVLTGVPPAFDVPLDPLTAEVFVTKQSSKDVAAIGDFVQYQVLIQNSDSSATVTQLKLIDTLPLGFRYASGSLQIDRVSGGAPDAARDSQVFEVPLPDLLPGESIDVRYVVEITAGASLGSARNLATVQGIGIGSTNVAFADIEVKEDLLQSKAIIIGQVFADGCGSEDPRGMSDVRIWLEDGTFVVTDQEGKFHIEGIDPGTHVVQMDLATVPVTHEPQSCDTNTRFAGSNYSQFVDVQGGTMWRADFYLTPKPNQRSEVIARLDAEAIDGMVHYTYRVKGGAVPLDNLRATLMLDEQLAFYGGSARIDGEPVADPGGIDIGAPTFVLGATNQGFEHTLEFDAFVKNPRGLLESKALLMFESQAGQHRSEVSINELSLNWPSSLIMVAESLRDSTIAAQVKVMSRQNRASLLQAQQANVQRLPLEPGRRPATKPAQRPVVAIQTEVHEPSRGSNLSRSNVSRTEVSVVDHGSRAQPYQLPELNRGESPVFDMTWLAANKNNLGIAWPPERYNPALPAVEVVVVHRKGHRAVLLVDGELANSVTYEGATTHHELGLSFSRWDNVTVSEHDSVIEARILDQQGVTVSAYKRPIHFSGAPAAAELVKEESYLVADGLYAPVVAVRLFDRAGYPLRPGTTGEFSVMAPYQPLDKAKHLENLDNKFNNYRYRVLTDGIAYIQLEPTTSTGEVQLRFEFDPVRSENIRARLIPGARDWIMVGLVEGTYAHNDTSGNAAALAQQDLDDDDLSDGRAAFYAKGMVSGEWLLTAAYDTDKKFERRLREQIDPNQFYTLYGDGTQQLYDAESARKLYLKLERSRFSALFGNFDTDFQRSELARYERRMNGVNLGYFGERVEAKVFASETDQAFIRDELRGDGTSGVYRLSNGRVVVNSEAVRIVTRDRFATEQVLEEVKLSRHIDYSIDFDRGTLIFKQPVFSQDERFNPVFIEVEYEIADEGASEEIVAGTRIAYRLDDADSEMAISYINDGTDGQGGELLAADLTWQFNPAQKLTVEFAQTDTDLLGSADAYLVELEHTTEKLAGRAYIREQEQAFGLGNQSVLEAGTRKLGIEGEYRLAQDVLIRGQSFQQKLLASDTERLVVNAIGEWHLADTKLSGGVQSVSEETSTGDSLDASQIVLGVAQNFMRNKLVLRSDAEVDVSSGSGNTDYPSRGVIGAEYEVFKDIHIIAEQELTWGDDRDTQDTRFGVRARPWTGGEINSAITQETGENAERLFATTGLLQQWRINERWLYDVGFDRVQTITDQTTGAADELLYNPRVPPASGSFDGDFSAFFTGFGYRHEAWEVSSRLELHTGDQTDKWNLLFGANHQLADGKVVAASMSMLNEETETGAVQDNTDLRLGLAWRPFESAWSFLNRTDLVFESRENQTFDTRTRKWVNNFNANFKPMGAHQIALQIGLKYAVETIDGREYDATTALYGLEYRYDLNAKWDLGLRGSALQSYGADVVKYSYGGSVGYNVMQNMWLSVGYNLQGFDDEDFIGSEYTAKGPYLKIRMKFDQDTAKRFLEFAGLKRDLGEDHHLD